MVTTPSIGSSARIRRAERSHHHAAKDNAGRSISPRTDRGGGGSTGELFGLLPAGCPGHAADGHGAGSSGIRRGRSSYERREADQAVYRNGYKRRAVATGEGGVELHVPQTRNGSEPFQTRILEAYRRRSETLEALIPTLYVKGLSVRDVSDTFREVFEDEGVSPATASRIGQTLREDFQAWQQRSLAGYDLLYLFVDGMYLKLHPERAEKQPVLLAYGILWDGRSPRRLAARGRGRPGELRGLPGVPAGHDRATVADPAAVLQR